MSVIDFPLLLITGASGFVGAHIAGQALEAGYPVRLTARPAKIETLRSKYQGKVEVYGIADLTTGDYSEALKGVGAIIHVASPLAGKDDAAAMINATVEGALNLVRQAASASVKRVVVTSSVITTQGKRKHEFLYDDIVLTEADWNPASIETALEVVKNQNLFEIYGTAKTVAERELWKFAEAHPEIDITTINPSYIYGPLTAGTEIRKGDFQALSTVAYFYQNILPPSGSSATIDRVKQENIPMTIDVRDVARAHILALRSPLTPEVGRKRILITGPSLTWVDSVIHLRKVMPELADRLPKVAEGAEDKKPLVAPTVDTSRAKTVLGLDVYIDWRKTAEDTAKSLLDLERSWGQAWDLKKSCKEELEPESV